MIRMSRQEAQALFGAPPPTVPAQAGATDKSNRGRPGPISSPEASVSVSPETLLARALPRLWHYALSRTAGSARTQRQKLRDLLVWVLSKRGFLLRERVLTPYRVAGVPVQGRLELLVEGSQGAPMLALETDFTEARDSVLKLEAWHNLNVPVLWVIGKRCSAAGLYEFRLFANRTLGRDTRGWLKIYHLEHGWLTGRRKSAT